MKTELINLLSTFGFPVMLQGSLAPDEPYPDSFFTFWNNSTDDGNHYDNDAASFIWNFDVNFYSNDPELVNSVLIQVRQLLRDNNWIIGGKGHDLPTDVITHTGRGITALFFEINKNMNNNGGF